MALLFVDMLGVRSRWHSGGRESAERAFSDFRSILTRAIQRSGSDKVVSGGLEADSAAIMCTSLKAAMQIGRTAFRMAFTGARKPDDERVWLRGVIIPANGIEELRTEHRLTEDLKQITLSEYSSPLLDAIAAEKAGFKGMRLLVGGKSNKATRKAHMIELFGKRLSPIMHIKAPPYPGRLGEGYRDVLWMASETEEEWQGMQKTMFNRLRWSVSNPDEFVHAAVTQVVFYACGSHFGAIKQQLEEAARPNLLI